MDAIIETQTGSKASIMRFPGGSNNTIGTDTNGMAKLTQQAAGRGLRYFDWTIISGDTSGDFNENTLLNNVKAELDLPYTQRYSVLMVLCHDQVEETVNMINDLIPWALDNDFVFLPITEDTPDVTFNVELPEVEEETEEAEEF